MPSERSLRPLILLSVCVLALDACDGYLSAPPSHLANNAQFVFVIPPTSTQQPQGALKKPLYTSPATASVSISGNVLTSQDDYYSSPYTQHAQQILNVSASGGACKADPTGTGNTICTVAMTLPLGVDTMTVSTYDKSNAQGNLLSQQIYAAQVSLSTTNAYSFALDADPATAVVVVTPAGTASGTQSAGFAMTTAGAQRFSVTFEDPDGYTMAGAGLPDLSVASATASVATAAVSGNVLTITPVGVGTSTITVTANPANSQTTSDGLSATAVSFPVSVSASSASPAPSAAASSPPSALIAVSLGGGTGGAQIGVYQYVFNTSGINAYGTIPNSVFGSSASLNAVQFDSLGNLYVGDAAGSAVSLFAASQLHQTVSSFSSRVNATGLAQNPTALAVSSDQLLAVGNGQSPTLTEYASGGQGGNTPSYQFSAGSTDVGEAVAFIPGAGSFAADSTAFIAGTQNNSWLYLCNGPASTSACSFFTTNGVVAPIPGIPFLEWSASAGKLYLANSYQFAQNLVYYTFSGITPTLHTVAANLNNYPTSLAVSPDGHVAVSSCSSYGNPTGCTVSMWDQNDALVSAWDAVSVPAVKGLSFLSNGDLAVAGSSLQIYTIGGSLVASTAFPSGYSAEAAATH